MSMQMHENQLDAELPTSLSIAELENLLDGKKAKLVILNKRKEGILAELATVDEKLEELSGLSSTNLSRSEAMKASWKRRRQNATKATKTKVKAKATFQVDELLRKRIDKTKVPETRPGSLLTVLLEVLGQCDVYMSLDTLAEEVIAAGWRGKNGKTPKNLKGSIYGTIYAYRKSGGYISYNKAAKTYSAAPLARASHVGSTDSV